MGEIQWFSRPKVAPQKKGSLEPREGMEEVVFNPTTSEYYVCMYEYYVLIELKQNRVRYLHHVCFSDES